MAEYLSIPGFYNARHAARILGVSEARIRKLASIYGWEHRSIGLTKLFSAADIGRYIQAREHLRRQLEASKSVGAERSIFE